MHDVVTRLQAGDTEAFREIVETYQARIRTLIAFSGIQPNDVDEIAQDAFIHAFEHIGEFKAGTNMEAWLKAIVRNKILAYWEATRRDQRNKSNALKMFLIDRLSGGNEDDETDMVSRLRRCISRLAEHAQAVIQKRYTGSSIRQIAQETGRSSAAMKMMLCRIHLQLRKCVETS